ncbi:hypothetical protein ACHAWF_004258 [Thalassiosira exigua]
MFVNNVAFFVTKSRKIMFYTAEHCPNRRASDLSSAISKVVNLYARGGFTVRAVLMDMEFDKLVDKVPLLEINTTAAREHVGDIERGIRVIKERARTMRADMPFAQLPRNFIVRLVFVALFWLNGFPAKNGISQCYSHV